MKRRNLFLSFVVIALLLIGIGYAAISDTLDVTGTIATDYAELDLMFVEAVAVTPTDSVASSHGVHSNGGYATPHADIKGSGTISNQTADSGQLYWNLNSDLVTLSVENLAHKGDKVQFVLTIKNVSAAGDMKAKLTTPDVANNHEEWFKVTAALSANEVEVGSTVTLTIEVELLQSVSEAGVSGTFTVDLAGSYTMANVPAPAEE